MSTTDKARAEAVPIIEMARGFEGATEVDRLGIVLMEAWGKADQKSSVSQHPASYVATFADMARAAIEWQASRKVEAAPSDTDREALIRSVLTAGIDWEGRDTGTWNRAASVVDVILSMLPRTSQSVHIEITAEIVEAAALDRVARVAFLESIVVARSSSQDTRDKARAALTALGRGDNE